MNRLLACSLSLLTFVSGCSKDSVGAMFDGNWAGTATDAAGAAVPMIAAFTYDPAATPAFTGSIDQGGYLYTVNGIVSTDGVATITAVYALGRQLTMQNITIEEETSMAGDHVVDICYVAGQAAPNPDPACQQPGTFTMEAQ